ncbi:hypothetical protein MBLNU13_g04176t1 [Cladosporium sp. NU13]
MPSKLDDSSNLRFLYVCLESGPQKRINFQEVAKEFGLSVPAARMRWRRLQISLGGDKQDCKVTKPKSAALNRKIKRVGKKSGVKEGLEMNWKGAKDGDNDDDDEEEEVTGGKVERRRGGNLKKEESEDDQAWKTLPEVVLPNTSGEEHSQVTVLSPPLQVAALYQNPLEAQPQAMLHHALLPVPSAASFEHSSNFLLSPDGNTYSSAHVALPQTQDGQVFLENPYYLQREPHQQFS